MNTPRSRRRSFLAAVLTLPLLAGLAACGEDEAQAGAGGGQSESGGGDPVDLRLGYFPNLTHAPALVGVREGLFEEHLPEGVTLETTTFNAGPEAVDAMIAGDVDITYIGPNPSLNAYVASGGELNRIIAGSTSGGASLVVRAGIDAVEDLAGTTLATPQLGNTQDVALRSYLADNGYETDTAGGGDVVILPQSNGDALGAFRSGEIDGAWVPEPFATRFVQEGGGHVLVDEATLWPDGEFVTTDIIVRTEFLEEHPDVVEAFLEGHLAALDALAADPEAAKAAANAHLEELTASPLADAVLDAAWAKLTFTADPLAATLEESAAHAVELGLSEEPVDLAGLYALDILNGLLEERGDEPVEGV